MCEDKASGFPISGACMDHQHWWHCTVLAVVRMISTSHDLVSGAWPSKKTKCLVQDARLLLGSAESRSTLSTRHRDAKQNTPGSWDLACAARCRALVAIRVNLSAAEKIGAMVCRDVEARRVGLICAIECMNDAIHCSRSDFPFPELYLERGGMHAIIGGAAMKESGERAGEDFATALWLYSRFGRRAGQTVDLDVDRNT